MAKRTNNDLQNITQKTKDGATCTPLKTGGAPEALAVPAPHVTPVGYSRHRTNIAESESDKHQSWLPWLGKPELLHLFTGPNFYNYLYGTFLRKKSQFVSKIKLFNFVLVWKFVFDYILLCKNYDETSNLTIQVVTPIFPKKRWMIT